MFAILIHIYYSHSWENIIRQQLLPLREYNPVLLINICNINNNIATTCALIRTDFPDAYFTVSPNKGKDMGGKLALVDLFMKLKLQAAYIIFLHDKMSPQAVRGDQWRDTLFSILHPPTVRNIMEEFAQNKRTGIVGAAAFVMNEYDHFTHRFDTNNNDKIIELLKKYRINIKEFSFIGGAMFWIRTSVITRFFSSFPALSCREDLETGNVMDHAGGTYTHTWERLICWIAVASQYKIKGI